MLDCYSVPEITPSLQKDIQTPAAHFNREKGRICTLQSETIFSPVWGGECFESGHQRQSYIFKTEKEKPLNSFIINKMIKAAKMKRGRKARCYKSKAMSPKTGGWLQFQSRQRKCGRLKTENSSIPSSEDNTLTHTQAGQGRVEGIRPSLSTSFHVYFTSPSLGITIKNLLYKKKRKSVQVFTKGRTRGKPRHLVFGFYNFSTFRFITVFQGFLHFSKRSLSGCVTSPRPAQVPEFIAALPFLSSSDRISTGVRITGV